MNISRTTLLATVITLGTLAVTQDAQACRRSGGGYYGGGYSPSYSAPPSYGGGYGPGPSYSAPPPANGGYPSGPGYQSSQPPQQPPAGPQMSALEALGGFAPPQAAPPRKSAPTYVGSWTAPIADGASIRLSLQNDGNFSWIATSKNGTASRFSGRYTVGKDSLTLIRGNDDQKLGGSMTYTNANTFSFKVAGNNAPAINFSRS